MNRRKLTHSLVRPAFYAKLRFTLLPNEIGRKRALAHSALKSLILFGENGAGDEIRTHDPNLGKVVLYH